MLPAAIESLSPLHRDILMQMMNVPGKRRLSYAHASRTWGLNREQFDAEIGKAVYAIRLYLRRFGITSAADLETG